MAQQVLTWPRNAATVPRRIGLAAAAIGLAIFVSAITPAAEIRLRAECRCQGSLVRLGDVAGVFAADPQEGSSLEDVELFPAPPPGGQHYVPFRRIQDVLLRRGINLTDHVFSGSSEVLLVGGADQARSVDIRPVSVAVLHRAGRELSQAVVDYLTQYVSDAKRWTAEVTLDDGQARLLSRAHGGISVRGGEPPWVGSQRFEVSVATADGPARFEVHAQVDVLPAVVVAARSLARGAIIRAADVQLEYQTPDEEPFSPFHSIEDVVGKETLRAMPVGKVLDSASVQAPLLVGRGDVVTVYARSPGIRVRTTARARDDGGLGDLVTVESLTDRKTYVARVCGIQEVEVFGRAVQAGERAQETGLRAAGTGTAHVAGRSWQ